MPYFMHTADALFQANNDPIMDTENFWVFNVITEHGEVFQAMTLFYTLQETLTLIHNAIDGTDQIAEMIIV